MTLVEGNGRFVARPHLERDSRTTRRGGCAEQMFHQHVADPTTLMRRIDCNCADVGIAIEDHDATMTNEPTGFFGHQMYSTLARHLLDRQFLGPRGRIDAPIDRTDVVNITKLGFSDHDRRQRR